MKIRIVKEKQATDYTFLDNAIPAAKFKSPRADEKVKKEPSFNPTETGASKLKQRSRTVAGHGLQGHSPVYE